MRGWRLGYEPGIAWTDSPSWGEEQNRMMDGSRHAKDWDDFEVTQLEESLCQNHRDALDVLVFYGGLQLLVSEKAKQCISDICPHEAEFLLVRYKGQRWWFLNAISVIDCLDLETSDYKTFSTGRIMWIYRYGFRQSAIESHLMFRAQGFPYDGPYVTDYFKDCIEKAGLKGFAFELLWDSSAEDAHSKEGGSTVMDEGESVFDYVGELSQDVVDEIQEASARAAQLVKAAPDASGRQVVEGICFLVDAVLSPCDENDESWIPNAAMGLGCLYGDVICREYGWKWMAFGPDEQSAAFGVVSPEGNYCLAPMSFILKIMNGENIGPDGQNDNTALLLFNMIDGIDERPGNQKMIPLG